jgi:hypothetical protein
VRKKTIWTWIYSGLIVFSGVVFGSLPFASFEAVRDCVILSGFCVFLALGQGAVWLVVDVMTFKRGGWRIPEFGEGWFANAGNPGFFLTKFFMALQLAGSVALSISPWRGFPSFEVGLTAFLCGFALIFWQNWLIRLFRARFGSRSDSVSQPVNRRWHHLRIR